MIHGEVAATREEERANVNCSSGKDLLHLKKTPERKASYLF